MQEYRERVRQGCFLLLGVLWGSLIGCLLWVFYGQSSRGLVLGLLIVIATWYPFQWLGTKIVNRIIK